MKSQNKISTNKHSSFFIFYLFMMSLLCSCGHTLQGRHGFSSTIEESRKREVFLYEILTDSIIVVNDTLSIPIKNCWIERDWAYGSSNIEETVFKRGSQLVIDTGEKACLDDYLRNWVIYYEPFSEYEEGMGKINGQILTLFEPQKAQSLNFSVMDDWTLIKNQDDYNIRLLGKFVLRTPEVFYKE